jgi:monofunctional biosynthetic peptidoglycan transglycosylase
MSKWAAGVAALLFGLVVLIQLYFFAMTGWYARVNPSSTAFMRSHMALVDERTPGAKLQQQWVPYARISDNLKRAVITSEDARFSEHEGVDWEAISKAYENNERVENDKTTGGRASRRRAGIKGGSTITQQLAKNLFLSGERSYVRKAQELVIAYMIEFWMTKQRILEIYLNVIEWGNGVFGAEAAARHYFGIPAAQLGPAQAAELAVMLPNPRFYDTHRDSAYLARRSAVIQRWMGDAELP